MTCVSKDMDTVRNAVFISLLAVACGKTLDAETRSHHDVACYIYPETSSSSPFSNTCQHGHRSSHHHTHHTSCVTTPMLCVVHHIDTRRSSACELYYANKLPYLHEHKYKFGHWWFKSEHLNEDRWIRSDSANCECCYKQHAVTATSTSTTKAPVTQNHNTANVQVVLKPSQIHESSQSDGLLILHNGAWGYACADGWTHYNSDVVCRMVGLKPGNSFFTDVTPGNYTFTMSGVTCNGSESNLADCHQDPVSRMSCHGGMAINIFCSQDYFNVSLVSTSGVPNQGELIIQQNGVWSKICAAGWTSRNNNVVCRMAGYPTKFAASFSENVTNTYPTNLNHFLCDGTEQDLASCSFQSTLQSSCPDDEHIVIHCGEAITTSTSTTTNSPTTNEVWVQIVG